MSPLCESPGTEKASTVFPVASWKKYKWRVCYYYMLQMGKRGLVTCGENWWRELVQYETRLVIFDERNRSRRVMNRIKMGVSKLCKNSMVKMWQARDL